MRLTDHTDYSLRVLMYLNQEKRLTTLAELARKLGISRNNLIKVSNQLAKLGFIETTAGRGGGLLIKEETGRLNITDVIRKTEESFYLAGCFDARKCDCTFLRNCLLKQSLKTALQAFFDSLAQTTIDDVTPKAAGRGLTPAR